MTTPASKPLRLGFLHARALGPSLVDVALIIVSPDGPDDNTHSDVEVITHTCAPASIAPHIFGDHTPAPCDPSPQQDAVRDILSNLYGLDAIYCLGPVREALKASALGLSPIFLQSSPLPAPALFISPLPDPHFVQPSHALLCILAPVGLPEPIALGLLTADALQEAAACLALACLHADTLPDDHAALLRALPTDHPALSPLAFILAPEDREEDTDSLPAHSDAAPKADAPKSSRPRKR